MTLSRSIILFLVTLLAVSASRVLLRDITSITLNRGQYTTGRRASPVPQLQCVGGTAQGRFSPKTVQCYNRGFDGIDPQWECTAEMPREYQFGKISVSCEGYDYSSDSYILAGSCGLKYELDYSTEGAKRSSTYSKGHTEPNYTYIIYFVCIAFVLYLLYCSMTSTHHGYEGDRNRGDSWPGDGPDGRGPYPPHTPGWRPPPPSYDETFKNTRGQGSTNTGSTGGSNFGFFSGLGLGGLGGYLLGNNWGRGNWGNNYGNAYRRRGPTQYEQDTGFYSDPNDRPGPSHYRHSSPSSNETHVSSGFGGTERR